MFEEGTNCEWRNFEGTWVRCVILRVIHYSPKSKGYYIKHETGTHTVDDEAYLRLAEGELCQ